MAAEGAGDAGALVTDARAVVDGLVVDVPDAAVAGLAGVVVGCLWVLLGWTS